MYNKKWNRETHTARKDSSLESFGEGKILFSEKRIIIETKDDEKYYVFGGNGKGYIHGDIVSYKITRKAASGKLAEARPISLRKRSTESLILEVNTSKDKIQLRILDIFGGMIVRAVYPPSEYIDGDLYIVKFINEKTVEILKFFGNKKDANMLEEIILFRGGVRREWPENLKHIHIREMKPLGNFSGMRLEGDFLIPTDTKLRDTTIFPKIKLENIRTDFRGWYTLTIDGSDAKDLDDAISIARYENGDYLLAVHIADVAEYVIAGSDLDREAYMRGTSIYTPGRVIPMLPEILSNDKCSLHPGEPKYTLSALLRIDTSGKVHDISIVEGIIESARKGVYDDIYHEISSGKADISLTHCNNLYNILTSRRGKEGKILFETTECYFKVDEQRQIEDIYKRQRNDAHMMIEEFMVLANEEVAKWCTLKKIPFLSRVHDAPSAEKEREIEDIIAIGRKKGVFDVSLISGNIEPKDIRKILEQAEKKNMLYKYSRLLLPKMSKAVYEERVKRHFGLALQYYTHFTSPIRRYPDLLLHRMIKNHLHTTPENGSEKSMKKWGISLSEKERNAEDISRAIDMLFMCRYMSDKIGNIYTGTISGLTESNIYVELDNGIEGSLFLKNQRKGIREASWKLETQNGIGTNLITGKVYEIGGTIRVKIREVDIYTRRIELDEVSI